MYRTAIVELPVLGYEPGLMTRPPAPACRSGLGCTPSDECGQCPGRTLGALADWTGGISLQTAGIAALAGLLIWRMLFSDRAGARRKKLAEARRDYQAAVARIRKEHPLL